MKPRRAAFKKGKNKGAQIIFSLYRRTPIPIRPEAEIRLKSLNYQNILVENIHSPEGEHPGKTKLICPAIPLIRKE